eukprot:10473590-Lingulodinium_polyedra.AAC.1
MSTATTTVGSSGSLSCARRRQSCAMPSPPAGMASAPVSAQACMLNSSSRLATRTRLAPHSS